MTGASADPVARRADLARGLDAVRARIEAACTAAGRDHEEVTLVVVTKFFPASDVRHLSDLGVTDVGENRHQEAAAKLAELDGPDGHHGAAPRPTRHMIGQVQTNKAAAVLGWADVVHSLDRPRLVDALDRAVERVDRPDPLDVLVQVDLRAHAGGMREAQGSGGRAGVSPSDLPALLARVAEARHLRLRGLMAVAPIGEGEPDADAAFARLADLATTARVDAPGATWLSAGMSGDLEAAVRHGATHLRVGSAILGPRPSPR